MHLFMPETVSFQDNKCTREEMPSNCDNNKFKQVGVEGVETKVNHTVLKTAMSTRPA